MIKDSLNNYDKYTDLSSNIIKGLKYLKNTDFNLLNDGKYFIDGEILYVNIQTYITKSNADYEAHRDYADIQYIISGQENIGVTDYTTCSTTIEYNKENDIEFLNGHGDFIKMDTGDFMILYPDDAHKPSISIDIKSPQKVRKAVVKVKLQ